MKKYKTIYADPPWKYGKAWGSGADKQYSLMSVKEISGLKIPADRNSHLYLWVPNAIIPAGLQVMEAWGFDYKTCITWVKNRSIFGYYFKGQTEQLLFGVRGSLPPMDRKQTTFLPARIIAHSVKPIETYRIIEAVSPPPRLELFARYKPPGWDVWGDEVRSDIKL